MADDKMAMSEQVREPSSIEIGSTGHVPNDASHPKEQGDEYARDDADGRPVVPQGKLKRTFSTRHVQMIALGANIGSGVYVSSGKVRQQHYIFILVYLSHSI